MEYSLPVKEEDFQRAVSDPRAHHGKTEHAIDFTLPEGTPILAAADGVVRDMYMDSDEGGTDDKFRENINKYTNRITIRHNDGELSQYGHLKYKSQKVEVGDKVRKGDIIAFSGSTGYVTQPHLHFQVITVLDKNGERDWESLEINWDEPLEVLRR